MWPTLADQCGLAYVPIEAAAGFDRLTGAVGVMSAGGMEEELETTLRQTASGQGGAIEIAAVGARADHRLAVALVRAGATTYFALPEDMALLSSWLRERAEALRADTKRLEFVASEASKFRFEGVLGESAALRTALDRAARIIPHASVTVLLTGETGTGKELVARAIHYNGPRRGAPFVDINCAAIPEQLLESELFGHEKGAFTGATVAKPGLFELANGGTLFLDEVGHLPLVLQGKLLRALEERTIRRVGGTRVIPIDVRVIAATHVELAAAVSRREFREDLFHRLNVVPIELPSLRARREDIPMLARHFLMRFAGEYALPVPVLSPAAERSLASRDWSGNIRELRNLMERTLLLTPKRTLDAEDFTEPTSVRRVAQDIPFPATMATITRAAARAMLEHCIGNKSEAARQLGISRPRLQRLLDANFDEHSDFNDEAEVGA
ncbi:MAG TPA: sigma-54 dependent transcriptional regulator [Gemmatimonadaceae bacterium]|nr:sigma-54 dependent transcriptional regulator [Gemmatimonadaceae bacterium]